jgi:dihydrofolate reductase
VITRQAGYAAAGAEVVRSLPQALAEPATWVIGGAEIYQLALPLADRCEVTDVDVDLPPRTGDALAPVLGEGWSAEAGPWQVEPCTLGGPRRARIPTSNHCADLAEPQQATGRDTP